MTRNERLQYQAKVALVELFSDPTVERTTAMENMQELRDQIDGFIEGLRADEVTEKLLAEKRLDHD